MRAVLALLAALLLGACRGAPPGGTVQPDRAGGTGASETAYLFEEVAVKSGLRYRWTLDPVRPLNILQTIGNGCAFLDFDADGNLDILLVGSPPGLYRGDGAGRFVDVSATSGLAGLKGRFLGCATGDIDNDGFIDLYLSAYRGGALLRNLDGKRFTEVSKRAGVPSQPWATSCAFYDANGDGLLDLYIGNYVDFGPKTDPQLCQYGSVLGACGPRFYKPLKGRLFVNIGAGRFRDATSEMRLESVSGKALGVAFAPAEGAATPWLAIANDEVAGDLLKLSGEGYENIAVIAGTAFDLSGKEYGGMGADWGDFDGDGRFDLLVATFRHEAKQLYVATGGASFTERSAETGLADVMKPFVTFGAKFADFDNDGFLDIAFANGHIQDNVALSDPETTFEQPSVLLRNAEGKRLLNLADNLPEAAKRPIVGRGLATGDYDNDGRTDLLIADSNGYPLLLHNVHPNPGNWIRLKLRGAKSNRDGVGAKVTIMAGGRTLIRKCGTDGSYLSASDVRVHAGIGTATVADVTVEFPGGATRTLRGLAANREIVVREDEPDT